MLNRFSSLAFVLAFAILATVVGPPEARADFVLEFGQAIYSAAPGQGIDVAVYLTEVGTDILASDGLNSAGLVVSFNLPTAVADPAQVSSIAANPGVNELDDFLTTSINPASASTAGTAELMFSVVLSDVLRSAAGSSSVLLGTFHFVAGSVAGGVTELSVGVLPGGPQFLSGAGQELDSLITTGTASIVVRGTGVVPEPSSLILAGIGVLIVGSRAWISRRSSESIASSHSQ